MDNFLEIKFYKTDLSRERILKQISKEVLKTISENYPIKKPSHSDGFTGDFYQNFAFE